MTDALISGIGQSQVGRRLGRSALSLTVDAALEAIADAGLTTADINGVSTWPGAFSASPGFSGVGCWDVQDALGLSLTWFSGGIESSGQLGAVINACATVSAGLANHVLCFRTVWESTAQTGAGAPPSSAPAATASTARSSGWFRSVRSRRRTGRR